MKTRCFWGGLPLLKKEYCDYTSLVSDELFPKDEMFLASRYPIAIFLVDFPANELHSLILPVLDLQSLNSNILPRRLKLKAYPPSVRIPFHSYSFFPRTVGIGNKLSNPHSSRGSTIIYPIKPQIMQILLPPYYAPTTSAFSNSRH